MTINDSVEAREEKAEQIWTQVDIFTTTDGLEVLGSALADIGHPASSIADAADFEGFLNKEYGAWDYYDRSLEKMRETETTITVYLPHDDEEKGSLDAIGEMLERLKARDTAGEWGRLEYNLTRMKGEDWATAWRKYYEPVAIGKKLMVCPSWEECEPEGRTVVLLDHGMAFGTGLDETTRLCLEALENEVEDGCSVLDVGCGSGILAIAVLLLGAGSALGTDIDPVAVKTANENAALNGVSARSDFICGNMADHAAGAYDIICANIAADAILAFAPETPKLLKPRGRLILSGIIESREKEVTRALQRLGFSLRGRSEENGWACLIAT